MNITEILNAATVNYAIGDELPAEVEAMEA